jgi:glycosyltransferase involved in cell wall biosynthesis
MGAASESDGLVRRLAAVRHRYKEATRQTTFDLTASHFALYALPLLDRLRSAPLVTHFHGPWALESEVEGASQFHLMMKRGVEKLVYGSSGRFIVLSEAFRNILSQEYGVPDDKIDIVPGGVDAQRFATPLSKSESREKLGWSLDRPIALSVRRLVRRVGLENLIAAMSHVRSKVPDVQLLIAGKGPLASELEARIAANDLEQHVRLLGFVPDAQLPVAYRAADVSVVPTRSLEGFGLVAVESLAAGTPVLVTPVGGLPEVVRDLSTDLIMTDGSPSAIQNHLVAALEGALKLPDSEACRAFAAEQYDWPVIAQQVKAVYEKML